MSAAEKLKALADEGTPRGPAWMEEFCERMYDALPQIVAVVETAEQGERYTNRDLERPFGGNRNSWMETEAIDAALAALDEALK